jgi:adenosine deaminase
MSTDWFVTIPKVELHVHLEGTMRPAIVAKLAQRNKITLPERVDPDTNTILWHNLFDFFGVYDACSEVIKTPRDITEVTFDYLIQAAAVGTIYVELTVAPQILAKQGVDYPTLCEAVAAGIEKAKTATGIEARMIMVLVRHYNHFDCLDVVKKMIAYPHPYVVGIGLAGDERHNGPAHFIEAFQLAREHGIHRTAHAGEWYGPQSIRDSIELLNVTRIGHGLQTIYDPDLIELVKQHNIHLEICLSSNIQTHAMANGIPVGHHQRPHPAREFKQLGISLSFSTDDPPYFQTNMAKEYQLACERFGFSKIDLIAATRRGILASFAEPELKRRLLKITDNWYAKSIPKID